MEIKLFEASTSDFLEDDINNFIRKSGPVTIEKIKYQVTSAGINNTELIFSALMVYEYTADLEKVQDQVLKEINCGIEDDDDV